MAADQAAKYTGKTLSELTEAMKALGSVAQHIPGVRGTFYPWDDCQRLKKPGRLKHRKPEPPTEKARPSRKPANKPAPTPVPAPAPEPTPEPTSTPDAPSARKSRDQRRTPKSTGTEEIPPYILEPDKLVAQLSQHGKGDLIHMAKDVGLPGPYGLRRAQIARAIVARQCEVWRTEHPNADVAQATDELAQRRKAKAEAKPQLPKRVRKPVPDVSATPVPTFSDGGDGGEWFSDGGNK
jgi:hypothetical protein